MHELALGEHRFARSVGHRLLVVLDELAIEPCGERAQRISLRYVLRDPRGRRAHHRGEIFHQCAKELRAGLRHGSFDHQAQCLLIRGEMFLFTHVLSLATSRSHVNRWCYLEVILASESGYESPRSRRGSIFVSLKENALCVLGAMPTSKLVIYSQHIMAEG